MAWVIWRSCVSLKCSRAGQAWREDTRKASLICSCGAQGVRAALERQGREVATPRRRRAQSRVATTATGRIAWAAGSTARQNEAEGVLRERVGLDVRDGHHIRGTDLRTASRGRRGGGFSTSTMDVIAGFRRGRDVAARPQGRAERGNGICLVVLLARASSVMRERSPKKPPRRMRASSRPWEEQSTWREARRGV